MISDFYEIRSLETRCEQSAFVHRLTAFAASDRTLRADGSLDAPPVLSWSLGKRRTGRPLGQKVVDDTIYLKRPRRGAMLKETVWQGEDGQVVKYSLAYVNPAICGVDNGRVLGYDNSHDHYHRHFMGKQESFEFTGYEALARRFYDEVRDLWRNEDEKRRKAH